MSKRIEMDLDNGVKLCAETSDGTGFRKIYVFLEKNGELWQDLAIVGEQVAVDACDRIIHQSGEYFVKVYADETTEDCTNEFTVRQYAGEN